MRKIGHSDPLGFLRLSAWIQSTPHATRALAPRSPPVLYVKKRNDPHTDDTKTVALMALVVGMVVGMVVEGHHARGKGAGPMLLLYQLLLRGVSGICQGDSSSRGNSRNRTRPRQQQKKQLQEQRRQLVTRKAHPGNSRHLVRACVRACVVGRHGDGNLPPASSVFCVSACAAVCSACG